MFPIHTNIPKDHVPYGHERRCVGLTFIMIMIMIVFRV